MNANEPMNVQANPPQPPPAAPATAPTPRQAFDPRRKSPVLAAFLSFAPGLGQVYIGDYVRGFAHAAIVVSLISLLNVVNSDPVIALFAPFLAFFWLYNVIDAGRRAALYNTAVQGGQTAFELPKDLPSKGGAMFAGIALLVIGVVALSNTVLGLSLEWVEDWWPLAPVAVGVILILRGMKDRAAS